MISMRWLKISSRLFCCSDVAGVGMDSFLPLSRDGLDKGAFLGSDRKEILLKDGVGGDMMRKEM